ncbi:inner membrane protein YhjD [Gordonia sp. HNM0687]|uniref:Inner membrane protein YhjD n=1 Tax=Gordonia mangrovi TaxID=2665643 RepID=A0A6L7GWS9_9ACTN|nr:YhjD/YihY/BrkB family envelope integrity protein [Gordonia mangrovi]MXP23075.1 inner membrane protein YhjD [Gordonia mangrovi]UVF77363.1 YihY/virulence factor BrkB family protein [Gordonia mangrovi]
MSSVVDSAKGTAERAKSGFATARERWTWLEHLIQTVQRYNDRRGNLYAASISFNGILALVPIVMVAFAIAGFVLANQPEILDQIQDAVVENMPGQLGDQVGDLIDSAIASRTTVGIVGLVGAAFTGIGWISGVRAGMTEMWGGRVTRNLVMSKVWDLLTFAVLGVAFTLTMALTTLGNSDLPNTILSWVGLDDASWAPTVIRAVSITVSVFASWLLFTIVMARLPLVQLPLRNTLKAGLVTAIAFEIVKTVGGIYLKSVLSSPAGVAFGPILGIMVFAYLASRIVLYAAAWCATDVANEQYQVEEEEQTPPPVLVSPNYQVSPAPRPATLVAVAGIGAAASAVVGWLLRR